MTRPLKCWDSFAKARCGRRGSERSRRPHEPIRQGEEGEGRRSPQAVACRKRGVERTWEALDVPACGKCSCSLQLLRHGRGNPDTEQCWTCAPLWTMVAGRRRSPVTGQARRMRLGSRSERRTPRWGKPTTRGRSRRKHAARKGHAARTCRTGAVCANLPAGHSKQGVPGNGHGLRGSECNRGTGCGKTPRPDLHGGFRVTGVPTGRRPKGGGKIHKSW